MKTIRLSFICLVIMLSMTACSANEQSVELDSDYIVSHVEASALRSEGIHYGVSYNINGEVKGAYISDSKRLSDGTYSVSLSLFDIYNSISYYDDSYYVDYKIRPWHNCIVKVGSDGDIISAKTVGAKSKEALEITNYGLSLKMINLYAEEVKSNITETEGMELFASYLCNRNEIVQAQYGFSCEVRSRNQREKTKVEITFDHYEFDEERFSSGPVPSLNQENISIDLDKYLNVISFAKMDIDNDGIVELCTMQPGPTSGLYTLVITASVNGITKYKNTFNLSSDIAFAEKDGVSQVLRNGEPCRMYVKDKCIVIDGLDEEYEGYWGSADWNYNLP